MKIEELSPATLSEVLLLVEEAFIPQDHEQATRELRASLNQEICYNETIGSFVQEPQYWVVKKNDRVVGFCGIFLTKDDRDEAVWGGWLGTSNQENRSGRLGVILVAKTLIEMKKTNKKYFRVDTSDDPEYAEALKIYLGLGAVPFREDEKIVDEPYFLKFLQIEAEKVNIARFESLLNKLLKSGH